MYNQLGIPEDELNQFRPYLRVYEKGNVIIQEGEIHDQRIFLLRKGEVNVLRKVGDNQLSIGKIEAVNFFGEMALVSHRPRTASIYVESDTVVVYEFDNPNLSTIMAHPKWGIMLLRRLADNLEERHKAYESAQIEIQQTKSEIGEMLGMLITLYSVSATSHANEQLFRIALPKILAHYMQNQELQFLIPDREQLQKYYRMGIIPEELYHLAIVTRSKLKDQLDPW